MVIVFITFQLIFIHSRQSWDIVAFHATKLKLLPRVEADNMASTQFDQDTNIRTWDPDHDHNVIINVLDRSPNDPT